MSQFYITLFVFGGIILWFLFDIYRIEQGARDTKHWKLAIGEVIRSDRAMKDKEWTQTIRYSYEADHQIYNGSSAYLWTEVPAAASIKKGQDIAILYDPDNHSTSILKKYHTRKHKRQESLLKIGAIAIIMIITLLEYV